MQYMTARKHQIEMSCEGYALLKEYGLCYDISEERTGKSLTTILLFLLTTRKKLLIITKKKAIPDWELLVNKVRNPGIMVHDKIVKMGEDREIDVINYESLHKRKIDPDMLVLDEAHNFLSRYPKPGKIFLNVARVAYGQPIVYLSATPCAESFSQLYHQLRVSAWSPFSEFKNFYDWFAVYGIPELQYVAGRQIRLHKKTKEEELKAIFSTLTYGVTRKSIGFKHEAEDRVHYVELNPYIEEYIETMRKDRVIFIGDFEIAADTVGALLHKMYQMEGGTLKADDGMRSETQKQYKHFVMGVYDKIDYIHREWGDTEDLVIMYFYQAEEALLKSHFKNAKVLQGTTYSEGISLKAYKHLVIYSMDWRTSKYIQRRSRQADMDRLEPIIVHYLLTKGGVSEMVYDSVVNKRENFNGRVFTQRYDK